MSEAIKFLIFLFGILLAVYLLVYALAEYGI